MNNKEIVSVFFNPVKGLKMLVLQAPIDKDMKLKPFLTEAELKELSSITGIDIKKLSFDNPQSEWYKPSWFSRVIITNEGLHLSKTTPRDKFILALIKSHTDIVAVNPVGVDVNADIIVNDEEMVKNLYRSKVKNEAGNLIEMFKMPTDEKEGLLYIYGIEIDRELDEIIYEVFNNDKDNICAVYKNTDKKELRTASILNRAMKAGVVTEEYGMLHLPAAMKVQPMSKSALITYMTSEKRQKLISTLAELIESKNIESGKVEYNA